MGIQKEILRVHAVTMVKPAKPTPPQMLYLSGVDQSMKCFRPSRTILFFPGLQSAGTQTAATIKAGLAATLVEFYPLAGRLIDDNGRFALDCNDAGVEFLEAESDFSFDKFVKDNYRIRPLFRQLVGLDSRAYSDHIEDPLVSIQITSFVGGITLGIAISHVTVDGHSFWHFVQSLSQVCSNHPISTHPFHHRTLLKPDTFLLNKVLAEHNLPEEEILLYNGDVDPSVASDEERDIADLKCLPSEELHQTIVHFDKEAMEKLRNECESDQNGSFTTFEALAAYIWRRMTVAQAWKEGVRVDFRIPVDIRARMVPALTASYCGNAIAATTVASTAEEMAKASLGKIAAKIRTCVRGMDDRHIKKALIARENEDLRKLGQGSVLLFILRNGSRFPVKDCDFGWGCPAAVRPPWVWREGFFTWYPNISYPGVIDVFVALSSYTHARFFSPDLYPSDPLPSLVYT